MSRNKVETFDKQIDNVFYPGIWHDPIMKHAVALCRAHEIKKRIIKEAEEASLRSVHRQQQLVKRNLAQLGRDNPGLFTESFVNSMMMGSE